MFIFFFLGALCCNHSKDNQMCRDVCEQISFHNNYKGYGDFIIVTLFWENLLDRSLTRDQSDVTNNVTN